MNRTKTNSYMKFEPWMLAALTGQLSNDSQICRNLIEVHLGKREASTEVELLWMEYWNDEPPPLDTLPDVYLRRAQALQRSLSSEDEARYSRIVHAYRLAAVCGSNRAEQWLKEQTLMPLKINSFWSSQYIDAWDVNGLA